MTLDKSYPLYSAAFRYFVAVAEAGSIRGAARKLNVVSSAVNRQILNLEQSFDVQLFERVGRGLRLSVAGGVLLKHAKKALVDLEGAIDALDDLSGLKRGIVKVAVVESIADSILPDIVVTFQDAYPGIEIDVQVMSSTKVTRAIASAECHVALTFNPSVQKGLNHVCTYSLPVGVVVAKHHPLALKDQCHFEDCLAFPVAMPTGQLSIGQTIGALMDSGGHQAGSIVRTNSLRFMRQLVLGGTYVAFQTRLGLASAEASRQLAFIPILDPQLAMEELVLLTNASHEPSLAPKEFTKHVEASLKNFTPN